MNLSYWILLGKKNGKESKRIYSLETINIITYEVLIQEFCQLDKVSLILASSHIILLGSLYNV
jgi:hypothetical protein